MGKSMSFKDVYDYCEELKRNYIKVCTRDHNSIACNNVMYRREVSEVASMVLYKLADKSSDVNSIYRECLFKFAPVEWELRNIRRLLTDGLSNAGKSPEMVRNLEYLIKIIGTEMADKYRKCYKDFLLEQKRTEKKMIKFALEKGCEPVIVYEEILEYAKELIKKNKGDDTLKKAINKVDEQNRRYITTGLAGRPTIGNYYFK